MIAIWLSYEYDDSRLQITLVYFTFALSLFFSLLVSQSLTANVYDDMMAIMLIVIIIIMHMP